MFAQGSLYSPKHHLEGANFLSDRANKRAMTTNKFANQNLCHPQGGTKGYDDLSDWTNQAALTGAQYSTISLNNALNCHDGNNLDMISDGDTAFDGSLGVHDTEQDEPPFWIPEGTFDGESCHHNNFTGALVPDLRSESSPAVSSIGQEDYHRGTHSPAICHTTSMTSNSYESLMTNASTTNQTAYLLSLFFPPLPPHLSPQDTCETKTTNHSDDLYQPLYIRSSEPKKREGWCGYCYPHGRWLPLRESSYNYDKKYAHGICPNTGRRFDDPVRLQPTWGKRNGKINIKVVHCEGLCGECGEWIRLGGRSGIANSWWRHAFRVRSACLLPANPGVSHVRGLL